VVPVAPPVDALRSTPPPAPLAPTEQAHRSIVPVIIGGAVFAIGVGAGIGFRLASNSKYDDAKALVAKNGAYGCYGVSSTDCATQKTAWQSKDRDRNLSTAGFIVAGAALLAVPIYWYWPRSNGSSRFTSASTIRLRGSIGSQESSVWLSGEF